MLKLILVNILACLCLVHGIKLHFSRDLAFDSNFKVGSDEEGSNANKILLSNDVVRVEHYYESLCYDCIHTYPVILDLVKKFKHRIDLHTFPFGKGEMKKDSNGKYIITCQHGEEECYGNKLHACAIDQLKDFVDYVPFINCLMSNRSTDLQADACGASFKIDVENMKSCAKGERGQKLLEFYGKETKKIIIKYVPCTFINRQVQKDGPALFDAICKAFNKPPQICNKLHDTPVKTKLV